MLKKNRLLLLLLVAAMLLPASMIWSAGAKEGAPVKLGGLVPLTGALSEFGEGFRKAGDLAVEQFNNAGFKLVIKSAFIPEIAFFCREVRRN